MTLDAILNSAKSAFKKMVSSSSDVSSKRVTGFEMAQIYLIMVIWHLITKQTVQESLVSSTVMLIFGLFGLNAAISVAEIMKNKVNPPDGTDSK